MQVKDTALRARNKLLSEKLLKNLKQRNFEAYYCDTKEAAAEKALSLILEGDTVSWGGSVTLEECGLLARVKETHTVIDRDTAESGEARVALMRQALLCDTYLTSFNAISEDGILVNIDGAGNRIAAIAYGPKSVIAVIGMHKVCKTVEDAVTRARTYAAPNNALRLTQDTAHTMEKTPCVITGACGNCKADDCICSHVVMTRMCKPAGRIKIILVGESLGL
ncbi:MAG: lactate utilization protein [Christensenellaceae bacterium]|jgi:L-lactate utilization protein LutB